MLAATLADEPTAPYGTTAYIYLHKQNSLMMIVAMFVPSNSSYWANGRKVPIPETNGGHQPTIYSSNPQELD
jgi:hypothetical protein